MLELKVEFRGDESTRVQNLMNTSKKGPTLTLSEYAVQGQKGKGGGKSGEEGETVVVVEPNEEGIDTPHLTVAVDRNFFENIERDVGVMKLQIKELTDLPSNQGLMEALQSEKTTPVLDMFQILNLKKRVDGVEVGINKLGSIFEDLAKGGTLSNALNEFNKAGGADGTESVAYGAGAGAGGGGVGAGVPGDLADILESLKNRLNYLETDGLLSMFKAKEAEILAFLKEAGLGGMTDEKAKEIDDKFKECMDRIASLDCMFNNQFEVFHNQLCDLEKELGVIQERLNSRNVNCISCDKDVIMRKELDTSLFPPKPGLPPTKSMAPYLAYELDALRKQQRCMPQGRDLNQFENMMSSPKKPDKGDHICNRYCGGSHTVTTPQQRVTRMGHFIQQWGPEGLSEEHHIKGTDGQFYKGSEIRSPKDEDIPEEAFKTRPSMMVQGDILTARTHLKSARISEAEMHVTEPEGQEKPRKSSAEVAEKRGSKSTPRGSKELPSPGPRGSKEVRRSSKGSKEEAEAGGGSRRGSKGSKGSKGPEEAQTPQGEEGGSPPEEESPPPAAEAEAEEGAAEATQEQA
ncbi:uncharacterized protein LOC108734577 isoform X2 [Agrilus planipennis]|nr:uncharacterized protein LOC108734577 isoform X2 [Agrilus planipennis]